MSKSIISFRNVTIKDEVKIKIQLKDPFGNTSYLLVTSDKFKTLLYKLCGSTGIPFALSNLQLGAFPERGNGTTTLPSDLDEFTTMNQLLSAIFWALKTSVESWEAIVYAKTA